MSWEKIENIRPSKAANTCPGDGIVIRARSIKFTGKKEARWIEITIGKLLADKLVLRHDSQPVAIALGSGGDTGMVGIAVDALGGFQAKRAKKNATYRISIPPESAAELFSLDFPSFTFAGVRVEHQNNQPPMAVFAPPPAFFAGD